MELEKELIKNNESEDEDEDEDETDSLDSEEELSVDEEEEQENINVDEKKKRGRKPKAASAALPVRPLGRKSTKNTCDSVRPEMMRKPRLANSSAITLAFLTTWAW